MNDTLAQLYSSTYASLGMPTDEILSRYELSTIVLRRLTYRLEAVRQSEQGEQISTTPLEFTLASGENEAVLTDLTTDFVIPMWAEFKNWPIMGNPTWTFLPTVNLSMLAEKRTRLQYACSFYGSDAREVRFQASLYGNEATIMNPNAATIRVWYSQDIPIPTSETSTIALPNNIVQMVYLDSLVSAIPLMQVNMAKYVSDRPHLVPQIARLDALYAHYQTEKAEFEKYFEQWRLESRGSHRPTMRGDVLGNVLGGAGGGGLNAWINNPPN
jgi:hypothetical protein